MKKKFEKRENFKNQWQLIIKKIVKQGNQTTKLFNDITKKRKHSIISRKFNKHRKNRIFNVEILKERQEIFMLTIRTSNGV